MREQKDTLARLFAATAVAFAVIVLGALFLIAPVWQPGYHTNPLDPAPAGNAAVPTAEQAPLLNINTATAEELTALDGIGESKAAAIVAYRLQNGPFHTLDELAEVKGISLKMVDGWRTQITLGT